MFFTRTNPAIRNRVQNGVRLLDSNVPDWRKHIDHGTLNVALNNSCVLGQLYGSFLVGSSKLGLGFVECLEYGFIADVNIPWDRQRIQYQKLTKEWKLAASA